MRLFLCSNLLNFMSSPFPKVNIRRAIPCDAKALSAIALQTFMDTYSAGSNAHHMRAYCEQFFGKAQQLAEIIHPQNAALLAYVDSQLVGFALLKQTPTPACITEDNAVLLSRFYVQKEWHGKGIATPLMLEVIQAVKAFGGQYIWLSMWEHNQRAYAYYTKEGFVHKGYTEFNFGTEIEIDPVFIKRV